MMMMISGFRAVSAPLLSALPIERPNVFIYSCDGRQKNFHVIDVRQWQYFKCEQAREGEIYLLCYKYTLIFLGLVCFEILPLSYINDVDFPGLPFHKYICCIYLCNVALHQDLTTGSDGASGAMNWAIKRTPRYEWAHFSSPRSQ